MPVGILIKTQLASRHTLNLPVEVVERYYAVMLMPRGFERCIPIPKEDFRSKIRPLVTLQKNYQMLHNDASGHG